MTLCPLSASMELGLQNDGFVFLYDQEYGLKFLIHSFLEFSLFYRLGWKGINNR